MQVEQRQKILLSFVVEGDRVLTITAAVPGERASSWFLSLLYPLQFYIYVLKTILKRLSHCKKICHSVVESTMTKLDLQREC